MTSIAEVIKAKSKVFKIDTLKLHHKPLLLMLNCYSWRYEVFNNIWQKFMCLPLPYMCNRAPPPHILLQTPAGEWLQTGQNNKAVITALRLKWTFPTTALCWWCASDAHSLLPDHRSFPGLWRSIQSDRWWREASRLLLWWQQGSECTRLQRSDRSHHKWWTHRLQYSIRFQLPPADTTAT